ncbi:hypothetical protein ACFLTH_12615 [Bacteroidota bacterium]
MQGKNKKGEAILSDIFAYFLFIIMVILFWGISTFMQNGIEDKTAGQIMQDETTTDFLLFLRQTTQYEGREYTIAGLIAESQYNLKKKKYLREELIKNELYDKYGEWWNLTIKYPYLSYKLYTGYKKSEEIMTKKNLPPEYLHNFEISSGKKKIYFGQDKEFVATATIPNYEGKNIEVEFRHWLPLIIEG